MSTSVVIPVYGRWDLTHQLLFDLYKNCSLIEEVIIVNDKPDDADTRNGLMWWKSTNMLPIEVIETKENLGFLLASNLGMKQAVEDVIILISTDVRVHKDIVGYMASLPVQNIVGGRLLDFNTGWNVFGSEIFPYLEGWILAARNKTWKDLEYFDELFTPNDYEDVDFSTKAIRWDHPLSVFPDGYVTHIGAQSIAYGESREAITKENRKRFEAKWT